LYNDLILNEKHSHQKLLKLEKEFKEKTLHSHNEIDSLQTQLKILQKQFEQLTNEHLKSIEQFDQNKNQINDNEQHLQDEIQRLRRDLGLELYRKQDAEKKARSLEDKLRNEQTQLQKIQYDFTKTKLDLKTLQVKYDALQLELIDMHKNTQEQPIIQTQQLPIRSKRRTNDESHVEQEIKKPKRVTRSRSGASSNNTSLNTYEQDTDKRPKRITRNGSTTSASNAIPVPIKQTKKKSSNVKLHFFVVTKNSFFYLGY
jgi:chromosome segregation ATPase